MKRSELFFELIFELLHSLYRRLSKLVEEYIVSYLYSAWLRTGGARRGETLLVMIQALRLIECSPLLRTTEIDRKLPKTCIDFLEEGFI